MLSKSYYFQQLWDLAEELGEVRRVGMDQQEISLLPVHTYQTPGDTAEGVGDKEGGDCRVCLVDFAGGDRLKTLPCCHIYHVECIDEWLKVCHCHCHIYHAECIDEWLKVCHCHCHIYHVECIDE